jgi:hypothetical protein
VLFFPQPPRPQSALSQICARRRWAVVTDPGDAFDLAIYWTTRTVRRPPATLAAIAARSPVLNLACRNIGKRHVDRVFEAVFGYRSLLDPGSPVGRCVRKSNLNATHDGMIVRCPVRRVRRQWVYQRLIDNRISRAAVEDLRTPVIGGEVPCVLRIRKPLSDRFDGVATAVRVETQRVFSPVEREHIRRFCTQMGLDYGELDVLRDRRDGRIFIVDANPTPWTPEGMPAPALASALDRQARAFEALAERSLARVAR